MSWWAWIGIGAGVLLLWLGWVALLGYVLAGSVASAVAPLRKKDGAP